MLQFLDVQVESGILKRVPGSPSPIFKFSHPLLANVAYASLPSDQRCEIHAAIALVLSQSENNNKGKESETISQHIALAGAILEN